MDFTVGFLEGDQIDQNALDQNEVDEAAEAKRIQDAKDSTVSKFQGDNKLL